MTAPIGSRYDVQREIARGGMGKILLARDTRLERPVVLKTVLSGSARAQSRFVEEAQITGQLVHPNIVPAHELLQHEGSLCLVMKYVVGRDLKEIVRAMRDGDAKLRAEYPLRRLLRLFLKVCDAMAYAHERGVVHRDLKPSNVMIGENDEVLVMDWGLARPVRGGATEPGPPSGRTLSADGAVRSEMRSTASGASGELTADGNVIGTPAYMPPEQVEDPSKVDARADVYSLGAILYELLCWAAPYSGSQASILTAVVTRDPPSPRQVAPSNDIPGSIEAIVQKAMKRDPRERYPDAGALAVEVTAWLDDRAVAAYRETTREAVVRLARHHRVALGAAIAAVVAIAACVVVAAVVVGAQAAASRAAATKAAEERTAAEAEVAASARASEEASRLLDSAASAGKAAQVVADFADAAAGAIPVDDLIALRRAARDKVGDSLAHKTAIDAATARALAGRAPARLVTLLDGGELMPGPEAALLRALAAGRCGKLDEVAPSLARARQVEGRPDLAAAAAALAAKLEDAPLDELAASLDRAIAACPDFGWLHTFRAEARARAGDLARAEEDWERALALGRSDGWTHASRFAFALPVYTKHDIYVGRLIGQVEQLAPECKEMRWPGRLIGLWHDAHGYDGWKSGIWTAAQSSELTDLDACRWIARGALIANREDDAIPWAKQALEKSPRDRVALGCLAEALLRQGKLDDAQKTADEGLARDPKDGRLAFVRGSILLARQDARGAVKWLELAARASLESDRWERLAQAYLAAGDADSLEKARGAARTAVSFDPYAALVVSPRARPLSADPQLERTAGDIRRKQGKPAAAAIHYARALLETQYSRVHDALPRPYLRDAMRLGAVHEEMGLYPEAALYYKLASEEPELKEEAQRALARLKK